MGNTIKNYQKKCRRVSKQARKELNRAVHNALVEKIGMPTELLAKEKEVFDKIYN